MSKLCCIARQRCIALNNDGKPCIDKVAEWMQANRLQLNATNTEVLWWASPRQQSKLPDTPLSIGRQPTWCPWQSNIQGALQIQDRSRQLRLWLVAWRDRSWLWRPVLDLQRAPGLRSAPALHSAPATSFSGTPAHWSAPTRRFFRLLRSVFSSVMLCFQGTASIQGAYCHNCVDVYGIHESVRLRDIRVFRHSDVRSYLVICHSYNPITLISSYYLFCKAAHCDSMVREWTKSLFC